eukprot:6212723-Pleurochrysis_carterae.AAC.1
MRKRKELVVSATTFTQRAKGGGVQQLLDRVILQEDQVRDGKVRARSGKRFSELGRSKQMRSVPKLVDVQESRLHLAISCEEAFHLMYTDCIPHIYDDAGNLHPQYNSAMFDALE